MNLDVTAYLGMAGLGTLGGFAFPFASEPQVQAIIPGLDSFGAAGAIIGVLIWLIIHGQRERVAEAKEFAERIKGMGDDYRQTVRDYQATTVDLIQRVLVHYERQIPEE